MTARLMSNTNFFLMKAARNDLKNFVGRCRLRSYRSEISKSESKLKIFVKAATINFLSHSKIYFESKTSMHFGHNKPFFLVNYLKLYS